MPGEEGRKTILGAKLAVPSGHVSRSGGPRSGSDVVGRSRGGAGGGGHSRASCAVPPSTPWGC